MSRLLSLFAGGYGGAIKAFLIVGAIVAALGYTYRAGVTHERKVWTDKQLVETVKQQAADIKIRNAAIASLAATAQAAQANTARRASETQSLKATIEKLKKTPSPCRLDDATRSLLNDYASGKAIAIDAATDNH